MSPSAPFSSLDSQLALGDHGRSAGDPTTVSGSGAPDSDPPSTDPLTIGALGIGVVALPLRPAVTGSDRNRRIGPAGGVT